MASELTPNVQGSRILELDFLRGVAIIMVMMNHFELAPVGHPVMRLIQQPFKLIGQTGVDIFFVLSGFLVGGLLLKEYLKTQTINCTRFILRRGFKIWPAYYFYVLFQIVAHKHPLSTFALQNLLHLQNYTGSKLSHTWTLSLEEHFYLLLTFSLGWMAKKHWPAARILKVLAATIPVVIFIRCFTVYKGWPGAAFYTHDRLDSLLFGVIIAIVFYFYPQVFEGIARKKWLLAGTAAAAVAFRCAVPSVAIQHSIGFTVLYIGYGALLLLVLRHSGRIKQWAPFRWTASIGLYSYGIYLWHNSPRQPVLAFAAHVPEALRWPVISIAELAAAIALGVLSTRLIEWPFLRIRDSIFPSNVEIRPRQEPAHVSARVEPTPEYAKS